MARSSSKRQHRPNPAPAPAPREPAQAPLARASLDLDLLQALMRPLLAGAGRGFESLKGLEYAAPGEAILAGGGEGHVVLLCEGAVPAQAPEGTLVIDVASGLPELGSVAALFSRHPLAGEETVGLSLSALGRAPVPEIDLVAIGAGPQAAAVMVWLARSGVRPAFVRLDAGAFDDTVRGALSEMGYSPLAAAEGIVYARPAVSDVQPAPVAADADKPSIRTFDVFDTLVARRCGPADAIFETIAAFIDSPVFVAVRKQAEAEVFSDHYTLNDIYARLAILADMPAEDAALLRNLELRLEIENAIPVAGNMAEVGPDDVLVSDMYLSADEIRAILRAAGFKGRNPILVRSRGKHTGASWTEMNAQFSISQHLGDNRHSDYLMARRAGVPARITAATQSTPAETALASDGFFLLARAMREARLSLHSDEPDLAEAYGFQTQANFPLLMLAGLHLSAVCEANGYDTALMASRDCNLWVRLLDRLAAAGRFAARPVYLETNRRWLRDPSPAYARYLRSLSGNRPVFVDLVGTGLSAQIFSAKTGIALPSYLVNDISSGAYAKQESARVGVRAAGATHQLAHRPIADADLIEVMNYDTCGTLKDLVEVGGTFVPLRAACEHGPAVLRRVEAMQTAFDACLAAMDRNGIDAIDDAGLFAQAGGAFLDYLYTQQAGFLMSRHREVEALASGA